MASFMLAIVYQHFPCEPTDLQKCGIQVDVVKKQGISRRQYYKSTGSIYNLLVVTVTTTQHHKMCPKKSPKIELLQTPGGGGEPGL